MSAFKDDSGAERMLVIGLLEMSKRISPLNQHSYGRKPLGREDARALRNDQHLAEWWAACHSTAQLKLLNERVLYDGDREHKSCREMAVDK